jgi:hypothetical protein
VHFSEEVNFLFNQFPFKERVRYAARMEEVINEKENGKTLKARGHLEKPGADARLVVRLISKKQNKRVWDGIM